MLPFLHILNNLLSHPGATPIWVRAFVIMIMILLVLMVSCNLEAARAFSTETGTFRWFVWDQDAESTAFVEGETRSMWEAQAAASNALQERGFVLEGS